MKASLYIHLFLQGGPVFQRMFDRSRESSTPGPQPLPALARSTALRHWTAPRLQSRSSTWGWQRHPESALPGLHDEDAVTDSWYDSNVRENDILFEYCFQTTSTSIHNDLLDSSGRARNGLNRIWRKTLVMWSRWPPGAWGLWTRIVARPWTPGPRQAANSYQCAAVTRARSWPSAEETSTSKVWEVCISFQFL